MFQVALSIIYMNREKVNELGDPIEIFQILQNMPRRLIDCPTFMDVRNIMSLFLHKDYLHLFIVCLFQEQQNCCCRYISNH